MPVSQNLKELVNRQRRLLAELDAESKALESADIIKENAALKSELEKLRADIKKIKDKSADLSDENSRLKNSLYGHVYNEKVKIVEASEAKLDIFFKNSVTEEKNRLTYLENVALARIYYMKKTLEGNRAELAGEINTMLDEVKSKLDSGITAARESADGIPGAFTKEERDELAALKSEQITDEQIRAVAKKNNLERFVGLNVLNSVGVFLLIIGAITLSRFVYADLPDILKGILLFVLGGVMLGAGEFLNRKKPNVFSLGLSAGGIGILYAALVTSYFGLEILAMIPALILCVLITAGAFALSVRYNSQVIASFALIGGYLPMFSIGTDGAMLYGAMIYFVALNLFALLISMRRMWRVPAFIGLGLNIIGSAYIALLVDWNGTSNLEAVTVLYLLFAFAVYTVIPVTRVLKGSGHFKKPDVVMLAVNTFFSSAIIYAVFYAYDWEDFHGLLAVVFAVIYLLLGYTIDRTRGRDDRHASGLFYLTGLAFVVLVIPLQFGIDWLSLGWLAEGVFISVYGIIYERKEFKRAGLVICALCFSAFVAFDFFLFSDQSLFVFKYAAVTLGGLGILGAYMYKKATSGRFVRAYKYFALTNLWLFFMYLFAAEIKLENLSFTLAMVATFALAYASPRIKLLFTPGMQIFQTVIYIIGIALVLFYNYISTSSEITDAVLLSVLAISSSLALRDMLWTFVTRGWLGMEWYPIIISGYAIIVLTQDLVFQYGLSFTSAVVSIIYVLTAFAWIAFGFLRRYSFIRKFGLGLAVLSVVKLFLLDLSGLTSGYRIVSYFALGITLIAISFLYQYFSKRLELKEGTVISGEKEKE